MTQRRPTIKDVAARSGVSKSTVSNVVRATGVVAEETRDKVLAAIQELGYRPNAAARNLVQRRTHLIGVVVGNIANAFNASLVMHIEREASAHGYATVVCSTGWHPDREAERIEALLEQRVDGIVLLEFSGDRSVLSQLLSERVPVVMVSCWADYADCVAVDDEAGIALAVEHLAGLGHRAIGYADDALMERTTRTARSDGFRRALVAAGLSFRAEWVAPMGDEADEETTRRWLGARHGAERPTAMVCANDFVAIRLIELLETSGLRVPDDVSLVGFDGVPMGALARLALTTVAQPRAELARLGVGLLLERFDQGHSAPVERRRLEPELIVRGSTSVAVTR